MPRKGNRYSVPIRKIRTDESRRNRRRDIYFQSKALIEFVEMYAALHHISFSRAVEIMIFEFRESYVDNL